VFGLDGSKPKSLANWKTKKELPYMLLSDPDKVSNCSHSILFLRSLLNFSEPRRTQLVVGLSDRTCLLPREVSLKK
jgi:peroxiredoxin